MYTNKICISMLYLHNSKYLNGYTKSPPTKVFSWEYLPTIRQSLFSVTSCNLQAWRYSGSYSIKRGDINWLKLDVCANKIEGKLQWTSATAIAYCTTLTGSSLFLVFSTLLIHACGKTSTHGERRDAVDVCLSNTFNYFVFVYCSTYTHAHLSNVWLVVFPWLPSCVPPEHSIAAVFPPNRMWF